jgi:tetratricopeptide (TPR) repeat protein
MATATASVPAFAPPIDPTRHLWQVPVLLLGIVAFLSVWQGWVPLGRNDPAAQFSREITALKNSYEKAAPDATELKALLSKVATNVDTYPESGPLARFHLGSGYVRLAEMTANPEEARGYWTLARQHFERVTDKQLRDPVDAPKLAFRSAKARAAIGLPNDAPQADLTLLITVLSATPPGEDAGETRRLIADLALRQNPPDLALAKISLTQYLTATGIATPSESLARARFRLGDIFLRTREYDQARKWLSQIGTDAPVDVLAPAKAELARVLMAEGDFVSAAKELEILRAAPGIPPLYRTGAAYDLALCKVKARDIDAATKLFEEAAKGNSDEARAAAVQLADIYLRGADATRHKLAASLLADSVRGVATPGAYKNELVPINEVQATFELAVATLIADRDFENALKVAENYANISAAGRDREKRADVLAGWGASLQRDKAASEVWQAKTKAAADEYAALAAFQPNTTGKLEMLRRAATLYRQAEQPTSAVVHLKQAVRLPGIPENVTGPLWVELADALLAAKQPDEVWKVFSEIMAGEKPTSTATRYRLARQFVDSRHAGLVPIGRSLFEQIAKQQNITPDEREFHERSLTELANDLIRQGNFADAESRLRTQLDVYPNGPEAELGKLLLGVCLLQRAAATTVAQPDAGKMRTEAVGLFKQIVTKCDAIERRNNKLTDREAWLRLQASLRVLQTYQQMRKPQDLLYEAAPMLDRYKGTVDELIVLSLVFHAFRQMNDEGKARSTRDLMKDAFDKLPATAFTQAAGEYSRDYWLKVWFAPEPK